MGSEEQLELELTPLEMIQKRYGDAKEGRIRAFLGHFGFDGNLVNHKIKTLSGGQKSRVSFALLTWTNPHLIVMDEPTNHLDLPTIDSLIGALEDFAGGIIVISHDLFFLTKIAAEFWAVDYAGGMKVFYDLDDAKEFSYRPIVWNVLEGMEKDIIRVDKKEERRQKRIERVKRQRKSFKMLTYPSIAKRLERRKKYILKNLTMKKNRRDLQIYGISWKSKKMIINQKTVMKKKKKKKKENRRKRKRKRKRKRTKKKRKIMKKKTRIGRKKKKKTIRRRRRKKKKMKVIQRAKKKKKMKAIRRRKRKRKRRKMK